MRIIQYRVKVACDDDNDKKNDDYNDNNDDEKKFNFSYITFSQHLFSI